MRGSLLSDFYITLIKALYTGLFIGIIIAIPMGPSGIESVRWTVSKGLKSGILVALGSVIVDAIDVMLINFGILALIETNKLLEGGFWLLSGVIIFYIGYMAKRSDGKNKLEKNENILPRKDIKAHPLLTGFIINISYPMTHFSWLALSSTYIRTWRVAGSLTYFIFAVSMLCGMFLSLIAINILASKGKKLVAPKLPANFNNLISYLIISVGSAFFIFGLYKLYQLLK